MSCPVPCVGDDRTVCSISETNAQMSLQCTRNCTWNKSLAVGKMQPMMQVLEQGGQWLQICDAPQAISLMYNLHACMHAMHTSRNRAEHGRNRYFRTSGGGCHSAARRAVPHACRRHTRPPSVLCFCGGRVTAARPDSSCRRTLRCSWRVGVCCRLRGQTCAETRNVWRW